jgi:Holliday junction resolvase RusA-like endonuclease
MIQSLFVPHRLPDLNSYIKAERTNRFIAAKMKKEATELVQQYALAAKLKPYSEPVWVSFTWREPDERKDLDNIFFAQKFALDGLVKSGLIPDDSRKWVKQLVPDIEVVGKNEVGVLIGIGEF